MGNLVVFPLGGERGEHALLGGVGMHVLRPLGRISASVERQLGRPASSHGANHVSSRAMSAKNSADLLSLGGSTTLPI
jgi:hypothetical protein